ncbi:MAG: NDP-hexose-3-ketoreductase [Phenylobacterium sp.]|jgi:NDP-hexose-3-ketoreductase
MMRIAVIGLGNHALRSTLPALVKCQQLELVGCYSRDSDKTKDIAQQYQINHWLEEDAVYADDSVDIIYIATPVGLHFGQIKKALEHNKHVFCEKSLVTSLAQAKQLCQLAKDNGLLLAECFMYLHHAQYAQLSALCADKVIGDVKSITARFGFPHIDSDNIRYNAVLGGGALLDAGVYPLSLIHSMAAGELTRFTGHIQSADGYEVDTDGAAFALMKNGVTAHAQWGMGRDYSNDIHIWGSQGQITVERAFAKPSTLKTTIKVIRNGKTENFAVAEDDHFVAMFTAFEQAIGNTEQELKHTEQILMIASMVNQLRFNINNDE